MNRFFTCTTTQFRAFYIIILCILVPSAYANTHILYPGDDLSQAFENAVPGDTILLHEGRYEGHIVSENSGTEEAPIVLMGYGKGEARPLIQDLNPAHNLWEIKGSNLVFEYLEFHGIGYGIRLGEVDGTCTNVIIKNCVFTENGDGDISANFKRCTYKNIRVLNNYFDGTHRAPVYIGNHQGNSPVEHFVFRGNIVDASQNYESPVGYGIQLKLNVVKSIIAYNFITGAKGPGIMVYGAEDMDSINSNIVLGNIIVNAGGAGINTGGGPSVVQNNILINCEMGIYVQNYGDRDLQDNIVLTDNTVIQYSDNGISYDNVSDIVKENNTVISYSENNAFIQPGPSPSDTFILISAETDSLVEEVIKVVPSMDFACVLWSRMATKADNLEEINLFLQAILDNSHPVREVH